MPLQASVRIPCQSPSVRVGKFCIRYISPIKSRAIWINSRCTSAILLSVKPPPLTAHRWTTVQEHCNCLVYTLNYICIPNTRQRWFCQKPSVYKLQAFCRSQIRAVIHARAVVGICFYRTVHLSNIELIQTWNILPETTLWHFGIFRTMQIFRAIPPRLEKPLTKGSEYLFWLICPLLGGVFPGYKVFSFKATPSL